MGWQFRKSKNLGLGVRLNQSKKGLGISWGFKGFRVGIGADGKTRTTLSIPKTGIRYTSVNGKGKAITKKDIRVFWKNALYILFLPITLPISIIKLLYKSIKK